MTDQRHTRAEIVAIKVSKYSTEELREMIKVYVTRKEFGNPEGADENDPEYEGGHLFDLRMGATEKENCKTCNQPITSCIGHFGGIEIPLPFLTKIDSDLKVLAMILKSFCPVCRKCHDCNHVSQTGSKQCEKCKSNKMCPKMLYNDVDFRKVINLNYQNKLSALASLDKKCPYHSNYKFKKIKANENFVVLTKDKKGSETEKVYEPDDLRNYLKSISDKDLELMGVFSRPENMVIEIIPVLPNYLRLPYVPDDGIPVEQGTNSLYKRIIDTRNELVKTLSGRVGMEKKGKKKKTVEKEKAGSEDKWVKLLEDIRTQHNDLIFSSDTKNNTKSYKRIIDKKEGLIRKNVHGKRGNYCARSVVVPDPTLNIYEVGLPEKIAKELTTEEYITEFNIKEMQYLLETGEVKSLKRQRVEKMSNELPDNILPFDDIFIQRMIDAENLNQIKKMQRIKEIIRGEKKEDVAIGIQLGDIVTYSVLYQDLTEEEKPFIVGYLIKSNNMMISSLGKDVLRKIKLKPNDLIHRFLRNGDVVTVNRNPTLHKNSILALIVEIRDGYCIRMPIQLCAGYGMDFDGDEANIFVPQSYKAKTNVLANMMPQNCMLSEQTHKVMVGVVQDALMGAYFMTSPNVYVNEGMFSDVAAFTFKYFERSFPAKNRAADLTSHILDVYKRSEKEGNVKFSGRTLFSIVFPADFYFMTMDKDDKIEIRNGILVSGQMNAGVLYKSHNSLIQAYTRRYGTYLAAELVGNISRMCQNYLSRRGFSVGISDCLARPEQEYSIKQKTVEALQKAKDLSEMVVPDPILAAVKENRILSTLNENQKVEQSSIIFKAGVVHKIKPNAKVSLVYIHETKTFTNENKTSQLEIHRKKNKVILFNNKSNTFTLEGLSTITIDDSEQTTVLPLETMENAFASALGAAAKGEAMQLGQIYGPLGQATFSGRRIPLTMANNTRVLPHFPQNSNDPMATGFTLNSYISGMNPVELYMNFIQAREPQTDTTIKTARTGYVQRKLVKYMQDLIVQEDHSVRNDKKRIVQFEYGKLGCSVDKMVEVDGESQFTNVVQRYNEVKLMKNHKNAYIFISDNLKNLIACGYQFHDQKSRFNVPWVQQLDDKTRREINGIIRNIKSYKEISDKDFAFLSERALRFEKDESKEWVEQNLLTLFLFYELEKLLPMKEVRELYLELKIKNQLQISYAFTILSFVLKELVCFVDITTSQEDVNQLEKLFDFVIVGGSKSDLPSLPYTRMVVFDNVDFVMTGGSDSFIFELPSGQVVDDVKGKILPFDVIVDNKVSDKPIKLNKDTPFKPKDLNQDTEKKWKILVRNSEKIVKTELK